MRIGIAAAAVVLWVPTAGYLTLADSLPRSLHDGLNSLLGHLTMGLAVTATSLVLLRAFNHGRRPKRSAVAVVVAGSSLFLLTTEALQSLTATRTPSLFDVITDLTGVAISTLLVAGPFEPSWLVPVRRGLTIPVLGVITAAALVAVVATQPTQPRVRSGMAAEAAGCIERLEYPDEPPAAPDPATASDLSNQAGPPLLALDLTGATSTVVRGVGLDGAPVLLDVTASSDARAGEPPADGMTFDGGTVAVRSQQPVTGLIDAVDESEAFTITMVFTPETLDQEGPARLLTISEGTQPADMNLQLGLQHGWLSLRIRSACDIWNWMALSPLPQGEVRLAVTYDNGMVDAYINGRHTGHAELDGADIGSWEPARRLVVGNEVTLNRGFVGIIRCLAIRDVAADRPQAMELSATRTC